MSEQYLLISVPSSGSDWLAGALHAAHPWLTSDPVAKEYFNPICNPRRYDVLKDAFGCELVDTYQHIADPLYDATSREEAENAYAGSWHLDPWNFTKEVFSPFRVKFFASRFTLLGIFREARYTFPPKRLRALAWYNAIWRSLVLQQQQHGWYFDSMIATLVDRAHAQAKQGLLFAAVAAHAIACAVARRDLKAAGVVPLNWTELMVYQGSELIDYIGHRLPPALNPERVAREIEATRLSAPQELDLRAAEFLRTGADPLRHTLDTIADGYGA